MKPNERLEELINAVHICRIFFPGASFKFVYDDNNTTQPKQTMNTPEQITVTKNQFTGEYCPWGENSETRMVLNPGQYIREGNTLYINYGGVKSDKHIWRNVTPYESAI